jgi:hypothetical protein
METMKEKHGENGQKEAYALGELGKLSNSVTSNQETAKKRLRGPRFVCCYCNQPILLSEPMVSRCLWVPYEKRRVLSYTEAKRQRGRERKYAHEKCAEERRY